MTIMSGWASEQKLKLREGLGEARDETCIQGVFMVLPFVHGEISQMRVLQIGLGHHPSGAVRVCQTRLRIFGAPLRMSRHVQIVGG